MLYSKNWLTEKSTDMTGHTIKVMTLNLFTWKNMQPVLRSHRFAAFIVSCSKSWTVKREEREVCQSYFHCTCLLAFHPCPLLASSLLGMSVEWRVLLWAFVCVYVPTAFTGCRICPNPVSSFTENSSKYLSYLCVLIAINGFISFYRSSLKQNLEGFTKVLMLSSWYKIFISLNIQEIA